MKTIPVSFKDNIEKNDWYKANPFLYTSKNKYINKKSYFKEHKYEFIGGGIATMAVIATLLSLPKLKK